MKKFRLQSKSLFLTFPKIASTESLQSIQDRIIQKEANLTYLLIGKESHRDASTHYHILLYYHKRKNVRSPQYFDYIFNKHGDYQITKQIKASQTYAKKDGNYLEGGKLPESKKGALESVIESIREGSMTTHEVIQNKTIDSHLLFKKVHQLDRFEQRLKQSEFDQKHMDKKLIKDFNLKHFTNPKFLEILNFIQNNLNPKRAYKSAMLHLGSKQPSTGKSSLVNALYNASPCYYGPDDNGFQHYHNNLYQFIIGDEFTLTGGQIQFLNRFFAGDSMALPMKGSHSYKSDNPLIILCSNQPLEKHVYDKGGQSNLRKANTYYRTLKARIHEIEVRERLFMDFDSGSPLFFKALRFDGEFANQQPMRIDNVPDKINIESIKGDN